MNSLLRSLGVLLLGVPFVGHAQSSELPTTPHFYGGLGVYTSSHQKLGRWYDQTRIPVQALVGYQVRPRLAVQLGLAYSGNGTDYSYSISYSSYYPSPPNTLIDYSGRYTERSMTASLLARYTLTRQAAHRFQADVLGGAKLAYTRYHEKGTRTSHDQAAPVTTTYEIPNSTTQPLLSLGLGLRYRLAPRLEVAYDFAFDQPLASGTTGANAPQASMALGLRYHFGAS
jgi:hypothetical protein